MRDAHILILKRSLWLWLAAALTAGVVVLAALDGGQLFITAALVITAIMAIGGIGFGVWCGRILAKAR